MGRQTGTTLRNTLPENDKLTGPLAAFRAGDVLPVEERVRVRLESDQDLAGAEVSVQALAGGQVRLKGVVKNEAQKARAAELAAKTVGVSSVVDDLAVPVDSIK
jgi:osmotically-inducible protein OsmY